MVSAVCVLVGTVIGTLYLAQNAPNTSTTITGRLSNLLPPGLHGFHVHEFGNISNNCAASGKHYNPFNVNHAGPMDAQRHIGDLGNVQADANGISDVQIQDHVISLYGDHSILGRALVVHIAADDLGRGGNDESLRTGNAGARLSCCVIEPASFSPYRFNPQEIFSLSMMAFAFLCMTNSLWG